MPRELITVQIGQCGLQVGSRFWELALREHSSHNSSGLFDESLSSFFRNVDARFNPPREIPVYSTQGLEQGAGGARAALSRIATLKARAVLVDMEEGVLNSLCTGPLGELFDDRQFIRDVSGSGNNFAHGHFFYGPQYGPAILESVRHIAETCDSLQAFFLMHSLGGGTGSGLGSYILRELADAYPDIYRFVTCISPSDQDDVVTSPYNSILSLGEIVQHADAVMPIHNQALIDICARINRPVPGQKDATEKASLADPDGGAAARKRAKAKAFDDMNTLAAQLLTSLTCSMRFEGELNVDLNEITMNLVPFPRMHFLLASLAPLGGGKWAASAAAAAAASSSSSDPRMPSSSSSLSSSKSIDAMCSALFSPESHLVKVDPRHVGCYLACGIFARGECSVSDLNRNIARLKRELQLIRWNTDGFKIGLCSVPPVGLRHSVLGLANSSCVADLLGDLLERHAKLYTRRAHFHHYTEYMEPHVMDEAVASVQGVVADYARLERKDMEQREEEARTGGPAPIQRMKPLG